jgi:hypothetical protein
MRTRLPRQRPMTTGPHEGPQRSGWNVPRLPLGPFHRRSAEATSHSLALRKIDLRPSETSPIRHPTEARTSTPQRTRPHRSGTSRDIVRAQNPISPQVYRDPPLLHFQSPCRSSGFEAPVPSDPDRAVACAQIGFHRKPIEPSCRVTISSCRTAHPLRFGLTPRRGGCDSPDDCSEVFAPQSLLSSMHVPRRCCDSCRTLMDIQSLSPLHAIALAQSTV